MESGIKFAKVTSMVVLGGAAFLVTLLPVFINKGLYSKSSAPVHELNSRSNFLLSLCLSFGGGVLLCTTFLHLLPEVSEGIETLANQGKIPEDFPLPLPELIMCCGFFVMYIVEEVVHKYLHSRQFQNVKERSDKHLNVSSVTLVDSDSTLTEDFKEITNQDAFRVEVIQPTHREDHKIFASGTGTKNYGSSSTHSSDEEVNHNCNQHQHSHDDHDHQPHAVHDHTIVTSESPSLRELLIVLALTIHEGFEGMAIGLEKSVEAVWYLMTAVAVHKCVIAFCIGVELVSGHVSLPLSVFYAFIYSCASPFGIAIGLALTSSTEDNPLKDIMSVILQGMATGTLLYVVFFEILRRDSHGGGGLAQMVVVIVGFSSMAALMVLTE